MDYGTYWLCFSSVAGYNPRVVGAYVQLGDGRMERTNRTGTGGLKLLFVEAPYYYDNGNVVVGQYFPLGIGYLAAYLRESGFEVRIFQPEHQNCFEQELVSYMDSFLPDMVCISVMTPSYPRAAAICDLVKSRYHSHTVLGGHHVSAVGDEVLRQSPNTDFAVIGEGEETLLELASELGNDAPDFSRINGLVWRGKGDLIVRNKPRGVIQDLDKLPFPARDLVDMNRFRIHSYIDFGRKSATMITSRGCPFKCMFCSSWLTMGTRYRFRSVANVMAEIEEIVNVRGVDHIVFEDDTMTQNRERMVQLCEALMDMPNRPTWYGLSRADTMDYELAKLMKKAGCRMVAFGIESGSPEVLKEIGKRITIEEAEEAVRACRQAGIRTQCTFIVGFPFDTKDSMRMTLDAAKRISPTIAIFFPLTPYPGTRVFDEFLDPSLVPQHITEWAEMIVTSNKSGISVNREFSGEELRRIADRWNRGFFFRPRQLIQLLKSVSSIGDFSRLARGGLYLLATLRRR